MQNNIDFKKILRESGMPVDEQTVRDTLQQAADDEKLVTNTSRMSPFWRLIQLLVIKPYLWIVDTLINNVLRNLFLQTAAGPFVDLFAAALRLTRKDATAAAGRIIFTKNTPDNSVTVPAGTLIQTERINGIIYTVATTEQVIIPAGTQSALIDVTATDSGTAFNLAPGYYQILPKAIDGIASVRNGDDWLTTPGADRESDDELKDRCRNQFNLAGSYHTDAVYRSLIAAQAGITIDRIFFLHDAPRGPGTANAYLLLDTGVISQPYVDSVNQYITDQGHHGHGDDMRCFAMPETRHTLAVTVYVENLSNISSDDITALKSGVENLIRCAFRENGNYDVTRTWPYSRFSFSQLSRELHNTFALVDSVTFSLADIKSDLTIPRLNTLTVEVQNA
ncbi:baseplate J/gp47 family protein [Salmonella enterica]|nr:baseplate J/gp47 family protein [Salmonella enterica]HCM4642866.1 baseplate J/gp47 family protein [Salmonella enterica subsp. enterica serovar Panama]EJJ4038662.1 baseplate J/gp47 family protein [Salmonella enterica]EJJ4053007.1 baseplate J/gp47 family protein [Salmonella enterica]EJJ4201784.1 baseplate J/gp47 family protein [Salmonella enterica]